MKSFINKLKNIISNNRFVIENYFFMTILQILNSFFYLLIYPYLIRTLGTEAYGTYIFATSVATYFLFVVNFGLDLPATKAVAENVGNKVELEKTLSCIFTAKTYLFILMSAVFLILLFTVPVFYNNKLIFILCFVAIYSFVLFPQWFFQGIQQMKIVTYIQLGIKVLSLPLIFLAVKTKQDLIIYTAIVSCSGIIGGIIAFMIINRNYEIRIKFQKRKELRKWFVAGKPFFYSTLAGSIKEYSIPIIIGSFFGMREVAIYDLANKIVIIPRTLFMSVNAAIFPKLIVNIRKSVVKKIILTEALVSSSVVVFIAVFGKLIVKIMGGNDMLDAYFLAIFLSVTVISWLVVGAYINFVFIPNDKNYFITVNQIIAMLSFFLFCIGGLILFPNILIFGMAMALSGLAEIGYCFYVSRKNNLI